MFFSIVILLNQIKPSDKCTMLSFTLLPCLILIIQRYLSSDRPIVDEMVYLSTFLNYFIFKTFGIIEHDRSCFSHACPCTWHDAAGWNGKTKLKTLQSKSFQFFMNWKDHFTQVLSE